MTDVQTPEAESLTPNVDLQEEKDVDLQTSVNVGQVEHQNDLVTSGNVGQVKVQNDLLTSDLSDRIGNDPSNSVHITSPLSKCDIKSYISGDALSKCDKEHDKTSDALRTCDKEHDTSSDDNNGQDRSNIQLSYSCEPSEQSSDIKNKTSTFSEAKLQFLAEHNGPSDHQNDDGTKEKKCDEKREVQSSVGSEFCDNSDINELVECNQITGCKESDESIAEICLQFTRNFKLALEQAESRDHVPPKNSQTFQPLRRATKKISNRVQFLQNQLQQEVTSGVSNKKSIEQLKRKLKDAEEMSASFENIRKHQRSVSRSSKSTRGSSSTRTRLCTTPGKRERPYRHWLGMAKVVTPGPDNRFIISSKDAGKDVASRQASSKTCNTFKDCHLKHSDNAIKEDDTNNPKDSVMYSKDIHHIIDKGVHKAQLSSQSNHTPNSSKELENKSDVSWTRDPAATHTTRDRVEELSFSIDRLKLDDESLSKESTGAALPNERDGNKTNTVLRNNVQFKYSDKPSIDDVPQNSDTGFLDYKSESMDNKGFVHSQNIFKNTDNCSSPPKDLLCDDVAPSYREEFQFDSSIRPEVFGMTYQLSSSNKPFTLSARPNQRQRHVAAGNRFISPTSRPNTPVSPSYNVRDSPPAKTRRRLTSPEENHQDPITEKRFTSPYYMPKRPAAEPTVYHPRSRGGLITSSPKRSSLDSQNRLRRYKERSSSRMAMKTGAMSLARTVPRRLGVEEAREVDDFHLRQGGTFSGDFGPASKSEKPRHAAGVCPLAGDSPGESVEEASRARLEERIRLLQSFPLKSTKYLTVMAIQDYRGKLPGQLSFKMGQFIKLRVPDSSEPPAGGLCYGYYKKGRLRTKKKGLFPISCVELTSEMQTSL